MTRRIKHGTKRLTRSRGASRGASRGVSRSAFRGGAQGAPLDQAFSGVVLPSDFPILKPMHGGACGGDGFAYQANLQPVPVKGRRVRRRSVKRRGKARGLPVGQPPGHALPVGHALPQGFGQMVQSFRPL